MFENAKWIGYEQLENNNKYEGHKTSYIGKNFLLSDDVKKATLNICGFGNGAYYINGSAVPDSYKPTHVAPIEKEIIYNTFDVTNMLSKGANRIGILLCNQRLKADMKPAVILQLDIEYSSGEKTAINSDLSFKTHPSHIVFTYNECGEIHDSTKYIDGWCDKNFNDEKWINAVERSGYSNNFITTNTPPMKKIAEHKGKEIAKNVFEFPTTTAGYVKVKVTGKKGNLIKINYSERLVPGKIKLDMATLKKDEKAFPDMYNSDEYILNGEKDQIFEQLFSYHGFRYAEVIGEYENIELTAVTVHTDLKTVSSFNCNNEIINKIHGACLNSMKTCCQDILVDNPKRDAKWTGDIFLSAEAFSMNFDCFDHYYHTMRLVCGLQGKNGSLPCIVDYKCDPWTHFAFIGPDWSDSLVYHLPYFTYLYTDNISIVKDFWQNMDKNLEYFKTLGDGGYLINKKGTGDWSAVKGGCRLEVSMTVYYYVATKIMEQLAVIIGKDANKYGTLAENIKSEFRRKYVNENGMNTENITEYIITAATGILTKEEEADAVEKIVSMIKADKMSFTFGVHGLRMVFDLLSKHGYGQLVFDVLTNENVLGYAYNVKMGYDTVPERFNYDIDPIFSLNHHFFSMVDAWFYKWIAGIKFNDLNKNSVEISPLPINGISSFKAELKGVKVEYKNNALSVKSPYGFTLKYKGINKKYPAGEYVF